MPCLPQSRVDAELEFLPFQLAWIYDDHPRKICEKSRRVGLTWAASYRRVRRASENPGLDAWWLTRDLVTAREFLRYCRTWMERLQPTMSPLVRTAPVLVGRKGQRAMCLEFENGSRIHVLSSNPDAAAGKGGDLGLDEFALHGRQEALFEVATPVTLWGGQLEIISTHRHSGTVFNRLTRSAMEPASGWSHLRMTLPQAVQQGLVDRLNVRATGLGRAARSTRAFMEETRASCLSESMWRQEYLCEPADDEEALLPYALITDCETSEEAMNGAVQLGRRLHDTRLCYAGMDVGRHAHLSVVWIVEELGDVLYTRRVEVLPKMEMSTQRDALVELLKAYGVVRCCVDATGLGMGLAEEARKLYRAHGSVEMVMFTQGVKDALATRVLRHFEDRKVRIVADPATREDLHGVRRVYGPSGHPRYDAAEGPNGHSDRFWALALAMQAAAHPRPEADPVDGMLAGRDAAARALL